jgi:catechol 2,3-dioxygenase-like lactoylglutathione lyase family enzyme
MLDGFNHAAVITGDLDAFVGFYAEIFDAEEVFRGEIPMDPGAPPIRHCLLKVGERALLHPVELPSNPSRQAEPAMFQRGHIDHPGLNVAGREAFDEARGRLAAAGATDGEVTDLGHQWSLFFTDPDGMQAELCCIHDPSFTGIHDPVPVDLPAG